MVWVDGVMEKERAIWGIDPVQALTLGMKLVEELTEKDRVEGEGSHTDWRIDVVKNAI